jgi:formylglycine-generating enzyme required for sulfatase activity
VKRLLGFVVAAVVVAAAAARLRAPGAGQGATGWTERVAGIEFIRVPAGSFTMGTPQTEAGREAQETEHRVTLSRAFYLGKYEVTQAQWTTVMGANPSQFADCGPSCPVERVSFQDVEEFISRLNARGDGGYRLPTEAEWEYACRAGGSQPFGHSSSLSSRDANIDGEFPYDAPRGGARNRTTRVGYFAANGWGFFDMSGNVWEWTADWYCPYPADGAIDPVGSCQSDYRVIRGGSWKFDGNSARCGLRYTHRPQDRGPSLGFRVAHD